MSYTWGEILQEIRLKLTEDVAAFYTDESLMLEWNQQQLYAVREARFLRSETDLTVSSVDLVSFGLPSDFLGVIGVSLVNSDATLSHLFPVGMHARSEDGLVRLGFFMPQTGLIRVTKAQTAGTQLRLSYYVKPSPFADETDTAVETDVPDEHINLIIRGVVAESYLRRSEFEKYQFHKQLYDQDLDRAIKAECRKLVTKQLTPVL